MNFLLYTVCLFTLTSQIAAAEQLLTFEAARSGVQEYLNERGQDLQKPPNGIVPDHKTVGIILKEVWGAQEIPDDYKFPICMFLIHGDSRGLFAVLLRRYIDSRKISDKALSEFFFHRGILGAKDPEGNLYVQQSTSDFRYPISHFHHFLDATIHQEQVHDLLALLKASNLSPQDYVNYSDLKAELQRQTEQWLKRNSKEKLSCYLPLGLDCLHELSDLVPPQIQVLDLSNNNFKIIKPEDFKRCHLLEKLILNNCGIQEIDLSFLLNVPNLKTLELCRNPIAQYPDTQAELKEAAQKVLMHDNLTITFK